MALLDKLSKAQGVKLLCGIKVIIGPEKMDQPQQFWVIPVQGESQSADKAQSQSARPLRHSERSAAESRVYPELVEGNPFPDSREGFLHSSDSVEMTPRAQSQSAAQAPRPPKPDEFVLLGLQYYGHILARYPKSQPETYELGSTLRQMIERVIEEGVWPESDLVRDAGVADKMVLAEVSDLSDPSDRSGCKEIQAGLIRPLLGDDLDLALDIPANTTEKELILSVVAVLQGLLRLLNSAGVDLLDKSLRYLRSYHDEGADFADPAAARNLANRALREAGGEAT